MSWFVPQLPMSFQSPASTSDGLAHFQTFWIGLQATWVVSLLLILSHGHLYDTCMFLLSFFT